MLTYIDEGVRTVKEFASIRPDLRALVEQLGGKVISWYVTQGQYDGVLAKRGRNRKQTMRAYTLDELQAILAKVP